MLTTWWITAFFSFIIWSDDEKVICKKILDKIGIVGAQVMRISSYSQCTLFLHVRTKIYWNEITANVFLFHFPFRYIWNNGAQFF